MSMASSEMDQARQLFDAFVLRVSQLDEMHKSSSRFLSGFQEAQEKLRRPLLLESSKLVVSLLKNNTTERALKYQEAGFCHILNEQEAVLRLNEFTKSLNEHLIQAHFLVQQLRDLVAQIAVLVENDLNLNYGKNSTTASILNLNQETCTQAVKSAHWENSDYAIIMSAMVDMFEKDLQMQELIIADMRLDIDSECLQTYSQMWLLRPFVNDNFINQWLR